MQHHILEIIYLIASVSFVIGLKMLSHPESARKGNLLAAGGMTLAIFGTLLFYKEGVSIFIYALICGAMLIGTVAGWLAAKKGKNDRDASNGFAFQRNGRRLCHADRFN